MNRNTWAVVSPSHLSVSRPLRLIIAKRLRSVDPSLVRRFPYWWNLSKNFPGRRPFLSAKVLIWIRKRSKKWQRKPSTIRGFGSLISGFKGTVLEDLIHAHVVAWRIIKAEVYLPLMMRRACGRNLSAVICVTCGLVPVNIPITKTTSKKENRTSTWLLMKIMTINEYWAVVVSLVFSVTGFLAFHPLMKLS